MALCATAPAFAADGDKVDTTGTYKASFYAYYDADKDGTSEWAPAPMGMDTGCITTGWTYDEEEGIIEMSFETFYMTYGTQQISGDITNITGAAVLSKTTTSKNNMTVLQSAEFDSDALTTVPGTNLEGIAANMSYSALYGAMTNNMDVYLVIEQV